MRIIVCGGRHFRDRAGAFAALDRLDAADRITRVAHGACGWDASFPSKQLMSNLRGADAFAHWWALDHGIHVEPYPAAWTLRGRIAGPLRNAIMLESEKPDAVVAFPGGNGTRGMVRLAKKGGIATIEVTPHGTTARQP